MNIYSMVPERRYCSSRMLAVHVLRGCLLLAPLSAWANQPGEAAAGSLELFDGGSLAGWNRIGEANWTVHEGAIESEGAGNGFLVTAGAHANYRLELEFWIDSATNSGIFAGCPTSVEINPEVCYEINIWDDHPNPPARTGSIVFEVMPPLQHVETIGRWNRMKILYTETQLEVRVNGSLTAELGNPRAAPGYIALQHFETGAVRFRDIRLTPQDPE